MATADQAIAARLLEMENMITLLASQVGELHRTSTARRLGALESTLTERGSAAPCGAGLRSRGLVDPKHLAPERFGADKGPAWKSWEYALRAFVGSVHPELAEAMKTVRHQGSAVTAAQLAALQVTTQMDSELRAVLQTCTRDLALTIVQTHDQHPGLEVYRRLAAHYEPDTDAKNLAEMQYIIQPAAANNMDDFAKKFVEWQANYQIYVNRNGPAAVLPDFMRRTVWVSMLPPKEREEVNRNRHLWTNAEDLQRHLQQLINDRTRGHAPMLYGFEQDTADDIESVIDEETGDVLLYKIEARGGRKVRTRVGTRAGAKPSGKVECYRCGRLGHISRDCHSKTHRDGGPLRAQGARGRSGAGALEEEGEQNPEAPSAAPCGAEEAPVESVRLGGLDLCALAKSARKIYLSELIPEKNPYHVPVPDLDSDPDLFEDPDQDLYQHSQQQHQPQQQLPVLSRPPGLFPAAAPCGAAGTCCGAQLPQQHPQPHLQPSQQQQPQQQAPASSLSSSSWPITHQYLDSAPRCQFHRVRCSCGACGNYHGSHKPPAIQRLHLSS